MAQLITSQYIYIYIFGPFEASFFFVAKNASRCRTEHLKRENLRSLSNMRCTNFPVFGDQILHDLGPNSPLQFFLEIAFLQPSPAYPETPIFVVFFFKFLGLNEDRLKMTRNGCQKECYYLVPDLRGSFLCWDQFPSFAKFTVLPVRPPPPLFFTSLSSIPLPGPQKAPKI